MNETNHIEQLTQALLEAKEREQAAKEARLDLEEQLLEAAQVEADQEGTLKLESGGIKVVIRTKLTRKPDFAAMRRQYPRRGVAPAQERRARPHQVAIC